MGLGGLEGFLPVAGGSPRGGGVGGYIDITGIAMKIHHMPQSSDLHCGREYSSQLSAPQTRKPPAFVPCGVVVLQNPCAFVMGVWGVRVLRSPAWGFFVLLPLLIVLGACSKPELVEHW